MRITSLNQLSFEEFRSTAQWATQDGRIILIKDLTNEHLVNILNWISEDPRLYPMDLYLLFEQEANYRKLLAFTANDAIPTKYTDGRWVTLLNGTETNQSTRQMHYITPKE